MRMRMEKGGPAALTAEEVNENASRHASSTESLIQGSDDYGQLMQNAGSTVARDVNSTATSVDASHLENPSSVPTFKEPPERVSVGYTFIGPQSSSGNGSSVTPGKDLTLHHEASHGSRSQEPVDTASTTSTVSELRPLAPEAYGGGLYGHDSRSDAAKPSASASQHRVSDSQSADGPPVTPLANVQELASSTDCGLDVTGQSYIQ